MKRDLTKAQVAALVGRWDAVLRGSGGPGAFEAELGALAGVAALASADRAEARDAAGAAGGRVVSAVKRRRIALLPASASAECVEARDAAAEWLLRLVTARLLRRETEYPLHEARGRHVVDVCVVRV